MDDVKVRVEALGQALGKLFFDRNWLVGVAIDSSLKLLQTVAQVGPLAGTLKCLQDLCKLVSEALSIYLTKHRAKGKHGMHLLL